MGKTTTLDFADRKSALLSWKDILPWQRDNEFVLTGYRHASFSYMRSFRSILEVHNETANIWSHLLGAAHVVLTLYTFLTLAPGTRKQDVIAVCLYQLGVVICFLLSTAYHTFSNHSTRMNRFGNELDHLGIVLVIWGTGISAAHFTFACQEESATRYFYFMLLSAAGVACAVFTLRPKFRLPSYRPLRSVIYCLLGISVSLPVGHGWIYRGLQSLEEMMDLTSLFGVAFLVLSGGAIYAARIPERWSPGTFDLLGQSHNWMHVLVYLGATVRLAGLLRSAERWQYDAMQLAYCRNLG